jgi:hypothetical protein
MKPTDKELEAIKVSEQFYQKQNTGFFNSLLKREFRFDNYETDEIKDMAVLWSKFGLITNDKFKFSDAQKIELINIWFNILYPFNMDIISSYNRDLEEFNRKARKFYQENPHIHVSWDFPSPEKYLKKLKDKFGFYDNPKFQKAEIDDNELFEMGIHYIKQKFLQDGFELIQYQEPPFVPQFILKKDGTTYFLYVKIKRSPFELNDIFSNDEIQGYVWSCQKREVNLLLAGVVFANGVNIDAPIYKEDKIEIDFTGLINMFE